MKILALDIETFPNIAYTWGLWDQNVGLNQIVEPGRMACFSAKWLGDKPTGPRGVIFHSEREGVGLMRQAAWDLLDEADVVVTWNGKTFDLPWIHTELIQGAFPPPSPYEQVDLFQAAKRKFRLPSYKLEYVSRTLGFKGKVSHEGFDLWKKCMAGDEAAWARMERYCRHDTHLLDGLYHKLLPWLPSHPNRQQYDGTSGCPRCAAPASKIRTNGMRHTQAASYKRYLCTGCGASFRGASSIRGRKSELRPIP